MNDQLLTFKPIGRIRNSMRLKFDAPSQPEKVGAQSTIELFPGHGYDQALKDLEGFDRIWLIWWFNRNTTWRPMVLPPRGSEKRRGLFATRSPHRPNPIGISAVELISISKLKITIGACDLMDDTPILDIKPYISKVDAFPEAKSGWLAEIENAHELEPEYEIVFSELAEKQISWLKSKNIDLLTRVNLILTRNPLPHRTRRISQIEDNLYRIGCGAWRLFYKLEAKQVIIISVAPGYPERTLLDELKTEVPHRSEQIEFSTIWP